MNDQVYSMFLPLIGIILMILIAYLATNWVAKKYKGVTSGRYIKVLERTMLGQDRFLVLIELGGKKYLLGVTGHQVTTIDTYEDGELAPLPEPVLPSDFNSILSGLMQKQQELRNRFKKKD